MYRVRNWDEYQAYPGRQMRWFKFYGADLCNDDTFYTLSEQQRLHLLSCWTIASVNDNQIPATGRFPARYNLSDEPIDFELLVAAGFLERVLESSGRQVAPHLNGKSESSVRPRLDKRREETPSSETLNIYEHWRLKRGKTHGRYEKISPARRQKIETRLREFSPDELKRAIDAVALDPWPERPRHDDLTVLFRSREQVDRFLEMWREPPAPPCSECGIGGGKHLAGCGLANVRAIA